MSSSSDEEWRKRGVEFKIIDEGGRKPKFNFQRRRKKLVFFGYFSSRPSTKVRLRGKRANCQIILREANNYSLISSERRNPKFPFQKISIFLEIWVKGHWQRWKTMWFWSVKSTIQKSPIRNINKFQNKLFWRQKVE